MIEIPGYRIQRVLGQGGMASVYLAVQESVQREVALKIMSPTLVGSEFGQRFLREARIAARLHHPSVVQVHDVGQHAGVHYMAMEHLSGGPAMRRGEHRRVEFSLKVTREIASALGYAHDKGVIHRDIKPDNILLREDGVAVLTDFGIARATDSTRMTQTGMVMGTPHYMAPEQATGKPTDGRADLYSLGVVLYELLLDRVPYNSTDWVAVGMMHISAPLPQLPAEMAAIQPLLDRLLTKDPERRMQSGAHLVEAIAELERVHYNTAAYPHARSDRSSQTRALSSSPDPAMAGSEPGLGSLDQVLATPTLRQRRARASQAQSPRRWPWLVVAALVLGSVGGAGYWNRGALGAWLQSTDYESLLVSAGSALQAGRLSSPSGDGALELYRSAAAADPDDERATEGLRRVGDAFVSRISPAIELGRFADARAALAGARELGVAANQLDPLELLISEREHADVQLGSVLEQAKSALAAGRIDDGENSALALYRTALRNAPDNPLAKAGLRDTLAQLLLRAGQQIDAGQLDLAELQIEAVAAIDPGHIAIVPVRSALAAARQQQEAAFTRRLDEAAGLLLNGQWVGPAERNARKSYLALLAERPGDNRVLQGLRNVAEAVLAQASASLDQVDLDAARRWLDEAAATDPMLDLAAVEQRLRRLQQQRAAAQAAPRQAVASEPKRPAATVEPVREPISAAQQAQIERDLIAARDAVERGDLVATPRESAFDRYKAVLAIDPGNAAALAGRSALPAEARQRFEDALGRTQLSRARGYIDSLETLNARDPALPDMRRRLSSGMAGYADERLGAGEFDRAREALNWARELDPANTALPALVARLEAASRK